MNAISSEPERLRRVEERLNGHEKTIAIYEVLYQEQRKHIDERFNRMQTEIAQIKTDLNKDVSSVKSAINRVLFAVITAVVLAFVQFVIKGGLNV